MRDEALAGRCRRLKLLLTDVDGVLTDGTLLFLSDGSEAKAFHVRDGLGLVLARRAGLRTGILTGRTSAVVARRAAELEMTVLRQGARDKLAAFREILAEEGLISEEVAYVGDDLNDLGVMAEVGLSAAPADAAPEVRARAFVVTEAPGGRGCLRELVEAILRARGDWERAVGLLGLPRP